MNIDKRKTIDARYDSEIGNSEEALPASPVEQDAPAKKVFDEDAPDDVLPVPHLDKDAPADDDAPVEQDLRSPAVRATTNRAQELSEPGSDVQSQHDVDGNNGDLLGGDEPEQTDRERSFTPSSSPPPSPSYMEPAPTVMGWASSRWVRRAPDSHPTGYWQRLRPDRRPPGV